MIMNSYNSLMVPTRLIEDSRISGNAFRLLIYLASRTEQEFETGSDDIKEALNLGIQAYRSALDSLQEAGYIWRDGDNILFFLEPREDVNNE